MINIKKNFFFIFTLLIISKNYSQDDNNMINTNYVNGEQQKTVAEIIFQNSLVQDKKMYFFSKNLFVDNKLFKYFLNFFYFYYCIDAIFKFDVLFCLLDSKLFTDIFLILRYYKLNPNKKNININDIFFIFFVFIIMNFFILITYIFFKNYYNEYNSSNVSKQSILNIIKTNNYKSIFSFIKLLIIVKICDICQIIIINNLLYRKQLPNDLECLNKYLDEFFNNGDNYFIGQEIYNKIQSTIEEFNTLGEDQKKKFISQSIISLKFFMIDIIQLILYIYILYKNNIINNNKNNVINILKSQIEILQKQEKNPNNPLTEKELEILNIKLIMNNDIIQLESDSNIKPSENNKTNFFKQIDGLDYIFGIQVLFILYYMIT